MEQIKQKVMVKAFGFNVCVVRYDGVLKCLKKEMWRM